MQEILAGVRERLAAAAAAAKLPPWPLAATAASSRAAVFLAARFSKVLRLIASIAAFSGVLAPSELQQLAFDNVIRKQVTLGNTFRRLNLCSTLAYTCQPPTRCCRWGLLLPAMGDHGICNKIRSSIQTASEARSPPSGMGE